MLKKIALALAGLVAGLLIVIALQPSFYVVERSATIAAPPTVVYATMADLNHFSAWSPWAERDPNLKTEVTGTAGTTGHKYAWTGNDDVGKGEMTITSVKPNEEVNIDLHFITPFESSAATSFLVVPEGEGSKVTWKMRAENDFMGKAMCLVLDMDEMLGKDFAKGLANLNTKIATVMAENAAKAPVPEAAPTDAPSDALEAAAPAQ